MAQDMAAKAAITAEPRQDGGVRLVFSRLPPEANFREIRFELSRAEWRDLVRHAEDA